MVKGYFTLISNYQNTHSRIGMISIEKAQSKDISFYRMMALIALIASIFFGVVFGFVDTDGEEYLWDRGLIVALCAMSLIYSYSSRVQRKTFIRLVYVVFYIFTFQVLWNNYLNEFNFLHLLSLILTIQAISISLRKRKEALRYLLLVNAAAITLVLVSDINSIENVCFIIGSLAMTSLLMYTVVHILSNFQSNARLKEEFLRIIVSKTEEAILITDFEGFINETNRTAINMFGYQDIEFFGKNFSDLRKKDLAKEEDTEGVRALLEDKFWNSEVELVTKEGEPFIAYVSISLIKKFQLEFLVYKVRDITSEKLAQKKLEEAKNEAEKAVNAKSSFLATMSHEIRTPMNGVIGMTQLLDHTPLNSTQSDYVNTIRSCGENLLVIINDILDFSKAESGKIELEQKKFDVRKQIDEVVKLLQNQAKDNSVVLETNIASETPQCIVGDSTRLKQIITNLVGNALKFTSEGSVEICLDCLDQEDDKYRLEFAVKDTGIGIPADKIGGLFESFSQVDSSTTRKFGGTGLGLAICKNLTELMGGELKVDSHLGEGSTFYFDAWFEGFAEENSVPDQNENTDWDASIGSKLSVLIAEDNVVNQRVAQLLLKSMGIEAEIAENGKVALEKLKQKHFDLIFMDIQMPEMDGFEASSLIRATIGADRKVPRVIAMTANALQEDRAKCMEAGMVDFVAKPIQKEELAECLIRSIPFISFSN